MGGLFYILCIATVLILLAYKILDDTYPAPLAYIIFVGEMCRSAVFLEQNNAIGEIYTSCVALS
jgi:hypothetical protein